VYVLQCVAMSAQFCEVKSESHSSSLSASMNSFSTMYSCLSSVFFLKKNVMCISLKYYYMYVYIIEILCVDIVSVMCQYCFSHYHSTIFCIDLDILLTFYSVSMSCSLLQYVAVCCSVLQCVAV